MILSRAHNDRKEGENRKKKGETRYIMPGRFSSLIPTHRCSFSRQAYSTHPGPETCREDYVKPLTARNRSLKLQVPMDT